MANPFARQSVPIRVRLRRDLVPELYRIAKAQSPQQTLAGLLRQLAESKARDGAGKNPPSPPAYNR